MWRHSKQHVIHEIALPPLTSETIMLSFSVVEYEYYKRLENEVRSSAFFHEGHNQLTNTYAQRQFEQLRQAATHPQITSSSTQLLGNKLLSMSEIGIKLIRKAEDDKNASERDLCRCLNQLAISYIHNNDKLRAENVLREVWQIIEKGIDLAYQHDKLQAELDKNNNNNNSSSNDNITNNSPTNKNKKSKDNKNELGNDDFEVCNIICIFEFYAFLYSLLLTSYYCTSICLLYTG